MAGQSLGNLTVNLGLNITGMARGLKQAQSKMQNFGENISKKSRKIRNFGLGMTAAVTAPIAAVGIASIKAAAQVETMEVAFKTLTGSAEEAKKIMADIATLSKATPFQFSGIGTAAKSLLAFGTESKDIIKTLQLVGDVAASVSAPIEDIARIYGKIIAGNQVFKEELNQLSDRGINVYKEFNKEFGFTAGEVNKLAAAGKITADVMHKMFENMVGPGGSAFKGMANQSKTLAGLWSTLKDNIFFLSVGIGQAISETFDLKGVMEDITGVIKKAINWFRTLDKTTRKWILGIALAVSLLGPLLLALGLVGMAIGGIVTGFGALAGATAFLLPLIPVVALIAAKVALVGAAIVGVISLIVGLFGGAQAVKGMFGALGDEAALFLKDWKRAIKEWGITFLTTIKIVGENIRNLWNKASLGLAKFGAKWVDVFRAKKSPLLRSLDKLSKEEKARHENAIAAINRVFQEAPDIKRKKKKDEGGDDDDVVKKQEIKELKKSNKFAGLATFRSEKGFQIRSKGLLRGKPGEDENQEANEETAENTRDMKVLMKKLNDKMDIEGKGIE